MARPKKTTSTVNLDDLVLETNTVDSTSVIEGEDTITVLKDNKHVTVLPVSKLEQYCHDELHIPYKSVLTVIDKLYLNVHGYTFKRT